jgi:peptidoglycan/LPS O-acetylase OafA/YrhL
VWTYLQTLVNSPGNLLFKAYLGFTNLTILFQELVMFLASTHGHVHWAADFWKTDLPLYQGLLIPQGWTLGIELSFYIIAPFLLKWRSRWLALVALFSLILKLVVVLQLHLGDPWNHRLFPIELGYFVVGALAFRNRAKLDWLIPKRVGKYVVYLLAIGFATMKAPVPLATLVYPLTLALLLPSMFRLTGSDKADRWIGELSYPFYIFHLLSIVIVRVALQRGWQTIEWAWAGLFLTLILSAVALVVEERYLEPWRSRFGQRPAAATTLTSREKRVERAAATAG